MTEFVITASFFLVPVFLLIPLLGKYIDARHAAIQSARYEAWEYTAWRSKGNTKDLYGFEETEPVKSPAELKKEARWRFFRSTRPGTATDGTATGLRATDKTSTLKVGDVNVLWHDHRGLALYGGPHREANDPNPAEKNSPDVTKIFTGVVNILDTVFEALASVLKFIGVDAGFTALDGKGYYKSQVQMKMAPLDWLDPDDELDGIDYVRNGVVMHAQAGVLSHGWNAGGREHAAYQVRGLVPTSLLRNDAFEVLQTIAGAVLASPELLPPDQFAKAKKVLEDDIGIFDDVEGGLEWGYIAHDAVHPDRLDPAGDSEECTLLTGKCEFPKD